jgi:hypothetical protein
MLNKPADFRLKYILASSEELYDETFDLFQNIME